MLSRRSNQDKNPGDDKGFTPLHVAAGGGKLETFKMIMNKADNPSDNNGWTPLHAAAKQGQREMCKFIADKIERIDPCFTNTTFGMFCLIKAVWLTKIEKNPKEFG